MAAPTYIAEATFATTTSDGSQTFVVPVPGTPQPGDWLSLKIRGQATTATAHFSHASWSLASPNYALPSATRRVSDILVREVTGTEPASYTFTRPANSGTQRVTGVVKLIRGASGVVASGITESTTYGGHDVPDDAGDTLTELAAMGEFTAPNNHAGGALPSSWDEAGASVEPSSGSLAVSRTAVRAVSRTNTDPIASTALPFVGTTVAPVTVSVTWAATPDPVWPVTVYDGAAEQTATLTVYDGADEQPVVEVLALPWTGYSITEMDAAIAADDLVYWAHRGGSLDWSEMTMRAYTNAVWHGARALEVSVHRSSDGVWIMSHDEDLTRVTATTHVIAATPAATMLGIPVDTPTTGGVIGRIEDLLEAYPDMVILVDNKPQTNRAELFALVKSLVPDWADRIIWKIDGANSASVFTEAQAEGFKVAGYWFDGAVDTTLPSRAADTDYIGLNYDATVGQWATAAAHGKPLWAHVLTAQADMDTGIARGALIMQCANVTDLVPAINAIP